MCCGRLVAVAAAAATTTAAAATAAAAATTAVAATTAAAVATTAAAAPTAAVAATTAGAGLRLEAIVAVDGTITPGLEWDFGFFAAGTAGCAEHFASAAAEAPAAAAAFRTTTGLAAGWAPPRLIREPLRCVKFLFARRKRER